MFLSETDAPIRYKLSRINWRKKFYNIATWCMNVCTVMKNETEAVKEREGVHCGVREWESLMKREKKIWKGKEEISGTERKMNRKEDWEREGGRSYRERDEKQDGEREKKEREEINREWQKRTKQRDQDKKLRQELKRKREREKERERERERETKR